MTSLIFAVLGAACLVWHHRKAIDYHKRLEAAKAAKAEKEKGEANGQTQI